MELFIQLIKLYGAGLLGYGFIFFIVLRIYNSKNYLRMALASLITGLILVILTASAIAVDSFKKGALIVDYSFIEPYYVFFNVAVLLTIIITLIYFIICKFRKKSFRGFYYKVKKTVVVKPTIKDKKDYVCYVFRHNDNFLLRKIKVDNEDYLSTNIEKLSNKIVFHDEMIKHIVAEYGLREDSHNHEMNYKLVGEVIKHDKFDHHYYCYVINVEEVVDKLKEYDEVSPYDLMNCKLSDFDKQVLFHIILKDYFKIEL